MNSARQRVRRALFLARYHPRFRPAGGHPPAGFITCAGKRGRAGSQALAVLSTMLFAERAGIQYLHTPFRHIERIPSPTAGPDAADADDDVEQRWEQFFNLGMGERCVDDVTSLGLETVPARSLMEVRPGRRQVLYRVKHGHEYANAYPDEYYRIIERFRAKYAASPKDGLPLHRDPSRLTVAVHVRRGDVRPDNMHAGRYTSNAAVAALVQGVLQAVRGHDRSPDVHLYSEGLLDDFGDLRDLPITFHLDESPFATFHNLASADVLVMSKSTYAYVAALLSRGVTVYESFAGTPLDHRPLGGWLRVGPGGAVDVSRLRQAVADTGRSR